MCNNAIIKANDIQPFREKYGMEFKSFLSQLGSILQHSGKVKLQPKVLEELIQGHNWPDTNKLINFYKAKRCFLLLLIDKDNKTICMYVAMFKMFSFFTCSVQISIIFTLKTDQSCFSTSNQPSLIPKLVIQNCSREQQMTYSLAKNFL